MQHVSNIQYVYLLNKYLKCSVWRLALWYDIYIYISLGFKRLTEKRVHIHNIYNRGPYYLSKLWSEFQYFTRCVRKIKIQRS